MALRESRVSPSELHGTSHSQPSSAALPRRRDGKDPALATKSVGKAEQAGRSASLAVLARVRLTAYGSMHLLVGWLALQIVWGASVKSADSSGALKALADLPFGRIMLWLVAVGLVALALWQAGEAVWGYQHRGGATRGRRQAVRARTPPHAHLHNEGAQWYEERTSDPRCPPVAATRHGDAQRTR